MNNTQNNKVILPPISNILRESVSSTYQPYSQGTMREYNVPRYEMGSPAGLGGPLGVRGSLYTSPRYVGYDGSWYGARYETSARYDGPRTYDSSPRFETCDRLPISPRYETKKVAMSPRPSFDATPRFEVPRFDATRYDRSRHESPETPGTVMALLPPLYKAHHEPKYQAKAVSPVSSKRKTRNNLPKETTYILINWLNDHLNHPYPNSFEKNQLMIATGLNHQQLLNWFINARRRKIKMLKEQRKLNS